MSGRHDSMACALPCRDEPGIPTIIRVETDGRRAVDGSDFARESSLVLADPDNGGAVKREVDRAAAT